MTFNIDSETFEFPCSSCGKKFKETIRRLKSNPRLTCGSCGAVNTVDTDQLRKVEQALKKSLDDIGKAFRKIGK
ncbi:hypothetical protein [Pandoraea pnomenusa]|uniref:hypothetical protein n=1 Tax=Pandoraea pnomenusa TaxID=93220 RepID=UPI001AC0DA44|nr:hypothetical protein [Pandoraea pnomenusa]MBN9096057.1 hypothetical protein [Pandoraea pnomenusa]